MNTSLDKMVHSFLYYLIICFPFIISIILGVYDLILYKFYNLNTIFLFYVGVFLLLLGFLGMIIMVKFGPKRDKKYM